MTVISIIAITIFVLGYLGITLEHKLNMSKSSFALLIGSLLWVLVSISVTINGVPEAAHIAEGGDMVRAYLSSELIHSAAEIFEIVIFLLAAMSLVEVLVEYQFFDIIRGKIYSLGLNDKKQFIVVTLLTFFLSAVIDNLTTTIVMITIATKFFQNKNKIIAVIAIVIAANAGGAFSPLGDVTTILLWLAGKFSALDVISKGFLPSLAIYVVAMALMVRQITNESGDATDEVIVKLTRSEKIVVASVFASFALPFLMSFLKLPPYLGLLIGLGAVWAIIDIFKQISSRKTHMEVSLERILQKTDLSSLKFFIGILLAVSALNALGLLTDMSQFFYGTDPNNFSRVFWGHVGLGGVSAILDNVPLTAIVIKVLADTHPDLWVLLAITVGTGGSFLAIGSAAGVVAMGMVKEVNFGSYLKIGTIPAVVGYAAGVAVWYIQHLIVT